MRIAIGISLACGIACACRSIALRRRGSSLNTFEYGAYLYLGIALVLTYIGR